MAEAAAVLNRAEYLRQTGLWAALSAETLEAVAAAMRPADFSAGESILRQGEPGRHLHILTRGEVEVRARAPGGAIFALATLREGTCFGEMSLLSGDVTSADVVATTDCETLMLDRAAFEALVAQQPNLLRDFVRMVTRRLRDTDAAMSTAHEKEKELTRFLKEARSDHTIQFIGKLPAMRELQRQIEAQAQLNEPLLIQGEPGTGKETIARLIHFRSARKEGPLLSTDCARIAESPWGNNLFGEHAANGGATPAITYMKLARGGTILLKNVDALPRSLQERLAAFLQDAAGDVRVIMSCRSNLAHLAQAKRASPALVAAACKHVLTIPPLRERKRDIPELATHLVLRHGQRLNKAAASLDTKAVSKLVTYDYRAGNVRELDDAIRRAVILSDEPEIREEVIFLGGHSPPSPLAFNLLKLPEATIKAGLKLFPRTIQALAAVCFAFILYECWFAAEGPEGNWGTLVGWALWWPAVVVSFFFVGRAWCAVCPMSAAGTGAQRLFNTGWHIPAWLKDYDMTIVMVGFFLITWTEEVTDMRHSPRATGWLLLCISFGAVVTALLLPRRTWCRHLCPLGGFASVCSMSSLVELRPTPDICSAKCKEHSCFKGDGHNQGCPMFNHVMFVDSNQHCVFCMKCVHSCPNGSPQLNVRLPARELLTTMSSRPEVGRFTALLACLLVGLALLRQWDHKAVGAAAAALSPYHFGVVTGVLTASAVLPQIAVWFLTRRLAADALVGFWHRATAWIPVVTAGFVSYQLTFLPGVTWLSLSVQAPARSFSISLLTIAQCVILTAGLALTLAVLWNLRAEEQSRRRRLAGLMLGATYWTILLLLIVV